MNSTIKNFIIESIRKGDIMLFIQPFVLLENNEVCGGEILTRMYFKNGKMIMPDEFLKVIEENELQSEFDIMVFSKACEWIRKCIDNSMSNKIITCNFFKQTIVKDSFVKKIIDIAQKYNIQFNIIGIEVLESDELSGNTKLAENLNTLHNSGFKILLDDWGKGYTSYEDLYNIQVDIMKLDKSIIKNIETERGKNIFENVVALAKKLNIKVLCEGIENDLQLNIVKHYDCDIGQGYGLYIPNELKKYSILLTGKECI